MKKVLLTGATGFIGRHAISHLLKKKYEIVAATSKEPSDLNPNVHWIRCDLFDTHQVSLMIKETCPSHLLHFAWYAVPGKFWSSELNKDWENASLKLLEKFSEHGGKRAVMAGTCAEYDWSNPYLSEDASLNPLTLYGASKKNLYQKASDYSLEKGISFAWGRIFHLFGPFEPAEKFIASVIRGLLLNQAVPCSHGGQIRDFLYVTDVAEAFVELLDSNVQGAVNVASGKGITLKDMALKIGELLNRRHLIEFGKISSNDPPCLVAETKRLSQDIKWNPKIDHEIGLRLSIEWWKNQLSSTL